MASQPAALHRRRCPVGAHCYTDARPLPARCARVHRVERLPGLPSSRLGLESLTGELDDFSFASYLNVPSESEAVPTDLHSTMEKRLGLDTKPCSRGVC